MQAPSTVAAPRAAADAYAIRVMLCDDSAVVRGLVSKWLEAEPGVAVVGAAVNGRQALTLAAQTRPDVIVLDIEMPEMDGLSALPHLLRAAPGARVLMSSTLTRRNADVSMRALQLGAADYVAKPDSHRGLTGSDDFKRELVAKIVALGGARKGRSGGAARIAAASAAESAARAPGQTLPAGAIKLRPASSQKPQILAIGSSTGGPQALFSLLKAIAPRLDVPVALTQHMPVTFTAILAEHIAKLVGLPAAEAQAGEVLKPKRVYVAPGDRHLLLVRKGTETIAELSDGPPENFCRPAVDPMFRSVASAFGPAALGVVLTGMGHDGREGGRAIAASGGTILAQDAATSVVWGMPGAVAEAGLCSGVHPLDRLGPEIVRILERRP